MQVKEVFPATMIRIHFSEKDRWQNKPLHEALLAKCQELKLSGAMVYRGIEGYGESARIHHSRALALSKDAPLMMSIIDTDANIAQLLPVLDNMVKDGLVVLSKVEAIRYSKNAA